MLWRKAWMDSRWRFLFGLGLLSLMGIGGVFEYSQVKQLLPMVSAPENGGAMSRAIRESLELSSTFRGYIWRNLFAQNFAQMGTLFAVLLASVGLRAERGGTIFTLSLPVTRRALMLTRAASGLGELFALTLVPSLLIPMLAPAVGEHYGVTDAVVHGLCLFAATSVFFGLTFLLSTMFDDVWRPGLIACAVALALFACEATLSGLEPFGIFHLMTAAGYFRTAELPWVAWLVALLLTGVLVQRAVATTERRDF